MICNSCESSREYIPSQSAWWCHTCENYLQGPIPPQHIARSAAAPVDADSLGVVLLLLPFIGTALIWLWVGESNLFNIRQNFNMTLAIVIIGSAILAAIDASNLRAKKDLLGSTPAVVGVGMLVMWIFVYPWYMIRRADVGEGIKNYSVGAILGMLTFTASALYLAVLMEEAFGELSRIFE